MRIASLLPATTEWLAELGLGEQVVAVSHECDHPPEVVRGRPRVTSSRVDATASAEEIDRRVKSLREAGEDLYAVDEAALSSLGVDVIVTQSQCDVCAVSEESVRALALRLPSRPRVVATSGSTIRGVLADVLAIGRACGVEDRARALSQRFERALDALREQRPARRIRAVHLEWTDPPMVAASWIPELADAAGLELFRADLAGEKSIAVRWEEIAAFAPELVVVAPCGFDLERARVEAAKVAERLPRTTRVVAADGNALFNRPGPRLVDSARFLAEQARAGTGARTA